MKAFITSLVVALGLIGLQGCRDCGPRTGACCSDKCECKGCCVNCQCKDCKCENCPGKVATTGLDAVFP